MDFIKTHPNNFDNFGNEFCNKFFTTRLPVWVVWSPVLMGQLGLIDDHLGTTVTALLRCQDLKQMLLTLEIAFGQVSFVRDMVLMFLKELFLSGMPDYQSNFSASTLEAFLSSREAKTIWFLVSMAFGLDFLKDVEPTGFVRFCMKLVPERFNNPMGIVKSALSVIDSFTKGTMRDFVTTWDWSVWSESDPRIQIKNRFDVLEADKKVILPTAVYASLPSKEGYRSVHQVLSELTELDMLASSLQPKDQLLMSKLISQIRTWKAELMQGGQAYRAAPILVGLRGPPQAGKTIISERINGIIGKAYGIDLTLHKQMATAKYWEAVDPTATSLLLEDVGSATDNRDTILSDLLQYIGNVPSELNMAAVEKKGKYYFNFLAVIMNSNFDDYGLSDIIKLKSAYMRRIVDVEARVKPQFCIDGTSMFDPNKADGSGDYWYFTVRRWGPKRDGTSAIVISTHSFEHIYSFAAHLMQVATNHLRTQMDYLRSLKCGVCDGCGLPSSTVNPDCGYPHTPVIMLTDADQPTLDSSSGLNADAFAIGPPVDCRESDAPMYQGYYGVPTVLNAAWLTTVVVGGRYWYLLARSFVSSVSDVRDCVMKWDFRFTRLKATISRWTALPSLSSMSHGDIARAYYGKHRGMFLGAGTIAGAVCLYKISQWSRHFTRVDTSVFEQVGFSDQSDTTRNISTGMDGLASEATEAMTGLPPPRTWVHTGKVYTCTPAALSSTRESIAKLATSSTYIVSLDEGKTYGFLYSNGHLVVPLHSVRHITGIRTITLTQWRGNGEFRVNVVINPNQFIRFPGHDLASIPVSIRGPTGIKKHVQRELLSKPDECWLVKPTENWDGDLYHITPLSIIENLAIGTSDDKTILKVSMEYGFNGNRSGNAGKGLCCCLVIGRYGSSWTIIGAHIAGRDSRGYLTVIPEMQPYMQSAVDAYHLGQLSGKSFINQTSGDKAYTVLGSIQDGFVKKFESDLIRPSWYSRVPDDMKSKKVPPRGRAQDDPSLPLMTPFTHFLNSSTPEPRFDIGELTTEAIMATEYLLSNRGKAGKYRLLSVHEAINGNKDTTIGPLDPNTSGGYNYTGPKSQYFICGTDPDDGRKFYVPDQRLEGDIRALWLQLEEGLTPMCPWSAFVKDEPISLEKANIGKARIILGSQLPFTILCRQVFGFVLDWFISGGTKACVAMGMNPMSDDWGNLFDYLTFDGMAKHGLIAIDYKSFDLSMHPSIMTAAYMVIEGIMLAHEATEEHIYYARLCFRNITHQIIAFGADFVEKHGGNPSGNAMTALLNCIVNLIIHVHCARRKNKDLQWLKENFRACFMGDDVLSNALDCGIDQFDLVRFAGEYGFTVTDASKGEVTRAYTPLNHATFLKRSFKPIRFTNGGLDFKVTDYANREFMMAPLDPESIHKTLNWSRKTKASRESTEQSACLSMVAETAIIDADLDVRIRDIISPVAGLWSTRDRSYFIKKLHDKQWDTYWDIPFHVSAADGDEPPPTGARGLATPFTVEF